LLQLLHPACTWVCLDPKVAILAWSDAVSALVRDLHVFAFLTMPA